MNIKQIRMQNLLLLHEKYGSAEFFRISEMAPSHFSQLKGLLKYPDNPRYRGLGNALARKLEKKFSLPQDWFDYPRTDLNDTGVPNMPVNASGLSTLQVATIDMATKLMKQRLLSDADCLRLLNAWQPLIEKMAHVE